jgi:hypothetical protein
LKGDPVLLIDPKEIPVASYLPPGFKDGFRTLESTFCTMINAELPIRNKA